MRLPRPPPHGPSHVSGKAKAALYPDEDARLLGCTAVPLANRVLYGFLTREGMRAGEAMRLTWEALDLDRGAVRLDKNKTDDPRAWALDPGTADALRRWRKLIGKPAASERVFASVTNPGHAADKLREHLAQAGVNRAELFESSDARRPIRVHDLRATFVTVALATGRPESWVTARTGHRSSSQVNGYRRTAATFADLRCAWFADMASAIPELAALEGELAAAQTAADAAANHPNRDTAPPVTTGKCTGGESNPYASRRRNLNPLRMPISPPVRGALSIPPRGGDATRRGQGQTQAPS